MKLPRRAFVMGSLAALTATPGRTRAAPPSPQRPTVAILFFDYAGKDAALEPLREGLAQMLISDFSAVPEVRVVERTRLKALLEEHHLVQSGKVDPASAARVGRLLGARFLVLGSYFDLKAVLRIDARVVEVETGRIAGSVGANGPAEDFWTIEQALSQKLGKVLAGTLPSFTSSEASRAPRPKVKTRTIATYGRALVALDGGRKAEAKALLDEVVKDAPQFSLAKSDLDALLK